jgi:RsiW-degrading membrane proteinase PrsW (M82 family)
MTHPQMLIIATTVLIVWLTVGYLMYAFDDDDDSITLKDVAGMALTGAVAYSAALLLIGLHYLY